jgi:hypothetical protein
MTDIVSKFISHELWTESQDERTMREYQIIDELSLIAGIYRYFMCGRDKLKQKPKSKSAKLAVAVESFRYQCKDLFNGVKFVRVDGVPYIPLINPIARDVLARFGRYMHHVHPFSASHVYGSKEILTVIYNFKPIYLRLIRLWPAVRSQHLPNTLGVLFNELMRVWPDVETQMAHLELSELRKAVVGLAFECIALRLYSQLHARDPEARSQLHAKDPEVRKFFWPIVFFYSRIDTEWDSMGGVDARAFDAYLRQTDSLRARFLNVAADTAERVHRKDAGVTTMRRYMASLSCPIERNAVQGGLDVLVALEVAHYYPSADVLQALEVELLKLEMMTMVIGESIEGVYDSGFDYGQAVQPGASDARRQTNAVDLVDSVGDVLLQTDVVGSSAALDDVLHDVEVISEEGPASSNAQADLEAKQKLSQSRRRRIAKKRLEEERAAECSDLLAELCGRVAQDAARDAIRLEEQYSLVIQDLAQELLAEVVQADARETAEAVLKDARVEEGHKAQLLVLQQMGNGTLPNDFKCKVLIRILLI